MPLEPSQQNENQNDKENDVQTAGRVTSPASTVRPAGKHCDHSVWENRRQGASWNQKSKAAFSVPGLTHSLSLIIVTRQRMLERLLLSSSIERTTFSPSLVPRIVIGACRPRTPCIASLHSWCSHKTGSLARAWRLEALIIVQVVSACSPPS